MRSIHNINKKVTFTTVSTRKTGRTRSLKVLWQAKSKITSKSTTKAMNPPENYIVIFLQNDKGRIDRHSTQTIGQAVNGEDKSVAEKSDACLFFYQ